MIFGRVVKFAWDSFFFLLILFFRFIPAISLSYSHVTFSVLGIALLCIWRVFRCCCCCCFSSFLYLFWPQLSQLSSNVYTQKQRPHCFNELKLYAVCKFIDWLISEDLNFSFRLSWTHYDQFIKWMWSILLAFFFYYDYCSFLGLLLSL